MLSITEKYRPKTFNDLVGNTDKFKEAFDLLKNNKSVVLVGNPGIGKTSFAYVVAHELGYVLEKTNASDERRRDELQSIERALRMQSFVPVLHLFDEVDGINDWSVIIRILKKIKKPLILTANDKRALPKELFKFCKLIELKPLRSYEIAKRIKEIATAEGITLDMSKITNDLRESINRIFYGSDSYLRSKSDFEKVDDIFRHREVHDIDSMWLIDNLTNYYNFSELLDALETIMSYEKYKNKDLLRSLPIASSGKPMFPNYYRQMVRRDV